MIDMDYFLLSQDKRYTKVPQIIDFFQKIYAIDLNPLRSDNIEDNNSFFVKSSEYNQFIDILENPRLLVSEDMRKIMEKYDRNIIFKRLALIDRERQIQKIYDIPIFEEVEALHEDTEFNWNKTVVKNIVLDKEKIKGKKIFKIKESDKTLAVVRLDLAESLLRREFEGMRLERLQVK